MNIAMLNKETLNKLKYVQLQKLAHKNNIKKRWAKKDELIEILLSLKNSSAQPNEVKDNMINEEAEWVDGSLFSDILPLPAVKEAEEASPSRETFTINKRISSSRSTYDLTSAFKDITDSRGTYHLTSAMSTLLPIASKAADKRQTFEVPKAPKLPPKSKISTKIKMLTIPISPVASRPKSARGNSTVSNQSLHKLSNKSIAIRKPKSVASPLKINPVDRKSIRPVLPQGTGRLSERIPQAISRVPCRQRTETQPAKPTVINKENISKKVEVHTLRRKSKSDDPAERRNLGRIVQSTFRTPPLKNATLSGNPKQEGQKTNFTAKKLPDFASIHQRNFEKMDSLDEYISKKADRVKKLFGTPMQKTVNVCIESRSTIQKENQVKRALLQKAAPVQDKQLERRKMLSKSQTLRTQTDVKDKTRSHIHGIRTNKRFELQMRFRNLE